MTASSVPPLPPKEGRQPRTGAKPDVHASDLEPGPLLLESLTSLQGLQVLCLDLMDGTPGLLLDARWGRGELGRRSATHGWGRVVGAPWRVWAVPQSP